MEETKEQIAFFFTTDRYGGEVIWSVRNCYRPKATRDFKELEELLNKGRIFSFGYKTFSQGELTL